MATILLGWELGQGLGHLRPLLKVAHALSSEGHQVILALCSPTESYGLLRDEPFPILQAPFLPVVLNEATKGFLATSLADVLAIMGWKDVNTLEALVRTWQGIIDVVRPQLIVCDYSPTLHLTAYQTVPVVHMGTWFCMPPCNQPTFPTLVDGHPPIVPQEKLVENVREVQRRRGRPAPASLPAILADGVSLALTLPELDPYLDLRPEPPLDPLEDLRPLAPPAPPSFFAYLGSQYPQTEAVLAALALTNCPGTVFVRGFTVEQREALRRLGLKVLDEPANLPEMLNRHAVLIHHGGAGTASQALAMGRPQILIPIHLEQITTGHLLQAQGVGLSLAGNLGPEAAARALHQILRDSRYASLAGTVARRLHGRPRRPALPAILEACRRSLK